MKAFHLTLTFCWSLFCLLSFGQRTASPSPIQSVETKTAIFVGYSQNTNKGSFRPVVIQSPVQYERAFGTSLSGGYLYESVKLFFQNGGQKCYVVSVGTQAGSPSLAALQKGLRASQKAPAQLVLIPDAVNLNEADFYRLQNEMISSCAQRGDRFAILNTVAPSANASQDFQAFRTQTQGSNLSYGAVYYPWLSLSSGQSVPPAGAVAGLMAKTDRQKGVWKAPANVQIQGIAGPTHALSNGEQQIAQVHSSGKSINPFIQMTGRGSVIWGSRTLAGNDNEWRYVPVRRFLMMVEQSVEKGLNWAVFEPNNANTWAQIEALCEAYLDDLWRQGAMQGSRAEKAYYVRCGQGVTMTANDVQQGRMIIEIGMATVRPAEFVVMKIVLQNR